MLLWPPVEKSGGYTPRLNETMNSIILAKELEGISLLRNQNLKDAEIAFHVLKECISVYEFTP